MDKPLPPAIKFHVVTLFPGMFTSPFAESIIGRSQAKGLVEVRLHNPRDRATDRHRTVDDYAFGGGPGMVMKPEPLFETVDAIRSTVSPDNGLPVILLSPQGRSLTQPMVEELSARRELVLLCGRYEGVDDRVRSRLATDEISVGDYVLSGGELAAMVLIDAVVRLVPGVVGSLESTQDDSFSTGLLQHPQFTRPAEYRGMTVTEVLVSGNHKEIAKWRHEESLRRTLQRRPDLLESADLSDEDRRFIEDLRREG